MGDNTGISWTDATWNPIRGCSRVSEGCRNCYAERVAARFCDAGQPYHGLADRTKPGSKWTGAVRIVPEHLADPLRWKKPRRIFVNSMSDLFHEKLTNEEIAAVFGVMAAAPGHTFQVLTKRAKRMREWFAWVVEQPTGLITIPRSPRLICRASAGRMLEAADGGYHPMLGTEPDPCGWPLPNVWVGVSVENQAAADERIPELLAAPAAVRFLSCEPLLGPVDIAQYFDPCSVPCGEEPWPELSWIIAGCESGPGARRCDVAWLRSLRDQCASARVAYFLKQAIPPSGSWATDAARPAPIECGDGSKLKGGVVVELPYLDGVQHAAFPA